MAKATCPRCGNQNATANAMGPNNIYCKTCGGLVPLGADPEPEYIGTDPLRNLIARESGWESQGVITAGSQRPLKGGL